jgi:septum formation protein
MLHEKIKNFKVILASKSPRRQALLKGLDIDFTVMTKEVDENFPEGLDQNEIALYLADKKSEAFLPELKDDRTILITADTIVWLEGHVLNKPEDRADARRMLKKLSGNTHEVVTGVCIRTKDRKIHFHANSFVHFKELSDYEIEYYLEHYKPYDKAGSYGVQEWIGYIGITHIEGSYFNVMGLPIQRVYEALVGIVKTED